MGLPHQRERQYALSGRFFVVLWRLFGAAHRMLSGWTLLIAYVLCLGSGVLREVAVYYVGLVPSEMYRVLVARNAADFTTVVLTSVIKVIGVASAAALSTWLQARFLVLFRDGLTRHLHAVYFSELRYYGLTCGLSELSLDNADQRITADVQRLSLEAGELLDKLVVWPGLVLYYTVQSALISSWYGPVLIFAEFAVAAAVNALLGSLLVPRVAEQERREGDLRFWHAGVRTHSEQIAFADGAAAAALHSNSLLARLVAVLLRVAWVRAFVVWGAQLNAYLGSMLSYAVVAVPILVGSLDDSMSDADVAALISKSSFINMYLIYNLSQVITLSDRWAAAAACAFRIDELFRMPAPPHGVVQPSQGGEPFIKVEGLTVRAPGTFSPLFYDLSLEVRRGEHLAIVGPPGAGKSTLLRVLRGIWPATAGNVWLPSDPEAVAFVSQSGLPPLPSLRAALGYPEGAASYEAAAALLETVGLLHLLRSEEDMFDYAASELTESENFAVPLVRNDGVEGGQVARAACALQLSPGQQQLLLFARLLYRRPLFALLDETTSALDDETATRMYSLCIAAGITLISVLHRPSLLRFHQRVLTLSDGSWRLAAAVQEERTT